MSGKVISVIDDDEATRSAVAGLMRANGFTVSAYGSAEEFLQGAGHAISICIITDIQMPGLSGVDLKHHSDVRKCCIPVIMITARVELRLHTLALASGAFCLLLKPFKAADLIECVERAIAG